MRIPPDTEVLRTDIHGNIIADGRRYWMTNRFNAIGYHVLRFEPANSLGQTELHVPAAQVRLASES